jgi:hypothetical protein
MTKRIIYTLLFIFSAVQIAAAQTDSTHKAVTGKEVVRYAPWYVERFRLSAGTFVPVNNTNIQLNAANGKIGTDIDFEKDLGFNTSQWTFIADAQWRLKRRSRFDLTYYRINRASTHTLTKDVNFGDSTYHVNTSLSSFFNTEIYRFSYGYAIFEKPRWELGLLIGTHVLHSNVGLNVNGASTSIAVGSDFGFTAPLPDFGIWGGYTFSPKFGFVGEVDYLGLTVGTITGRILGGTINFMYHVVDHFDLSLGYTGLNFKVNATKNNLSGVFKWGYNGPALTASYSFGKKYWKH